MHALHLVVDFALVGTVPHPRDEAVQLHDDEGEEVFLRHKMHQPDEWMREKKTTEWIIFFGLFRVHVGLKNWRQNLILPRVRARPFVTMSQSSGRGTALPARNLPAGSCDGAAVGQLLPPPEPSAVSSEEGRGRGPWPRCGCRSFRLSGKPGTSGWRFWQRPKQPACWQSGPRWPSGSCSPPG